MTIFWVIFLDMTSKIQAVILHQISRLLHTQGNRCCINFFNPFTTEQLRVIILQLLHEAGTLKPTKLSCLGRNCKAWGVAEFQRPWLVASGMLGSEGTAGWWRVLCKGRHQSTEWAEDMHYLTGSSATKSKLSSQAPSEGLHCYVPQ